MRFPSVVLIASLLVVGCNTGGEAVVNEDVAQPGPDFVTADLGAEVAGPDAAPDTPSWHDVADLGPDGVVPACDPGDGCFLDPCAENAECQSGWCVEHMGEGVCTMTCTEECPEGWSCQQVGGTDPDVIFICVSDFANLCKPCATGAGCTGVGGTDDVCLDYGDEGSFCGGACKATVDCPEGFSCTETETVDGVTLSQCVADAGVCECTATSVALALWTPCLSENEFGACEGMRVCTEDGLSGCDAGTPGAESCNGLDDDCDGEADEPDLVDGVYVPLCDDGNPCTMDACDAEVGCVYEVMDGGECADGDVCTVGDHCEAGECVGLPVDCDDGNPCTDDFCDGLGGCSAEPNAADCDDGDPCTAGDHCSDGVCAGESVDCQCQVDADCAALEDDDLCNGTLICDLDAFPHLCVVDPDTEIECPEPAEGPDAYCLKTTCDGETGDCGFAPDHEGLACEDGDACTFGDACADGACVPGGPLACADGNPCTDDACDPEVGCKYTLNAAACDDGNPCTAGDHCEDGACVSDGLTDCDDQDACTTDSCDPATGGCIYTLNADPCDDGDLCTTGDHCHLGSCIAGGALSCDDGNVCTDDTCEALSGCVFSANAAPCDDGNPCSLGDHCEDAWCVPTSFEDCDDGNPCTDDSCDLVGGCLHANNAAPCDDGDACTVVDACALGACVGVGLPNCDDGNVCTDHACDPDIGCVYTNNAAPCDDGDACTPVNFCADGICMGTGVADCDDFNLCTDDSCDPDTGCISVPNAAPCDDGDACTVTDVCGGGVCDGSGALECDDGDLCTTDSCDPATGCMSETIFPCCGNNVTEAPETCDDGNQTSGDGCDATCQTESSGCVHIGVDVRTLEQGPEDWNLGYCNSAYCENTPRVIPFGWHIASIAEVAHLVAFVEFGSCGAYGVCGSYWYKGDQLTANCNMLQYTCTTGGCTAYTEHCYTQVLLIKDGKDGTCHTGP